MSIKLPDIVQKARVDLTDYRKSAAEATRLGKSLSTSLNDANKSAKDLDKTSKALSADLDKVDVRTRRVRTSINETTKATRLGSTEFTRYRTSIRGVNTDLVNTERGMSRLLGTFGKIRSALSGGLPDIVQNVRLNDQTGGRVAGVGALHDVVQRVRVKVDRSAISEVRKLGQDLTVAFSDGSSGARGLATDVRAVKNSLTDAEKGASRFRAVLTQMKQDRKTGAANIGSFLGNLVNELKVPAIAGGVQLLTASISALTAGAIGMGSALAPVVGLLGAMPGLLLATKGPLLVLSGMFSPINKAADAIAKYGANSTQAVAAMKGMSAAQKGLVTSLGGVKKGYQDLLKVSTESAAPGLTKAFKGIDGLMKTLRPQFKAFGAVVGDLGQRFAGVFSKGDGLRKTQGILSSTVKVFSNLGRGAVNFAHALLNVTSAARPLTERLSKDFQNISGGILKASGDTGRMTRFFDLAYRIGKNLAQAGFSVVKAFGNIGRIGSQVFGGGAALSKGIKGGADSLLAWTKSGPGVEKITKFFADAKPVLHEINLLLRDIAKDILAMSSNSALAPLIAQIRTELLPAVNDLVSGVGSQLGPAIVHAATAFTKFLNVLSFSPLLTVVGTFASLASSIADFASHIPLLSTGLATILSILLAIKGIKIVGEFSGITALIGAFKPGATGGLANFIGEFRKGTPAVGGFGHALEATGYSAVAYAGGVKAAEKQTLTFAGRLGGAARAGLSGNLAGVRASFVKTGAEAERFGSKMKALGKIGLFAAVAAGASAVSNSLFKMNLNGGEDINTLEKRMIAFSRGSKTALDSLSVGALGAKDDLKTAMDELVSPNIGTRIGNTLGDVVNTIGGIFGLHATTPIEAYKAELSSVSDTLAQMVTDGHAKEAAKTFEELKAAFVARGAGTAQDFTALFGSYTNALDGAANAADGATAAVKTLDDTINALKGTVAPAADATVALGDAIRQAEGDLGAIKGAAEKGGKSLNLYSAAGAEAQSRLEGISNAALDGVASWEKNGESADQIAGKIQRARDAFIKTAEAAGLIPSAAAALATAYGLIPKTVKTQVLLDTSQAKAALGGVQALIARLRQTPDVHIAVIYDQTTGKTIVQAPRFLRITKGAPAPTKAQAAAQDPINKRLRPRAIGGPTPKDKPFLVGEKGMELFVPKMNGAIVSNDRLRAAARAAAMPGPLVPGGKGGAPKPPIINNIDNSRTYNVTVNETRGPSTQDSITSRLRSIEAVTVG